LHPTVGRGKEKKEKRERVLTPQVCPNLRGKQGTRGAPRPNEGEGSGFCGRAHVI